MERSRSDEPLFFLAFVSDYVDDGQERHQEADFAVDSAEVRMDGSSKQQMAVAASPLTVVRRNTHHRIRVTVFRLRAKRANQLSIL